MKDVALDIAMTLIAETNSLTDALNIFDLVESGVDGVLLREVVEHMNKLGYVVDTHFSEGFMKVVDKNIKECKTILEKIEIPSVRNELEMLMAKPNIFFGMKYGNADNLKTECDTGIPLLVNKYTRSSARLMRLSSSVSKEVILLDGELLSYDSSSLQHKKPN